MDESLIYDVIVVGSGPSGAQCAASLCERNTQVLMLDVGNTNDNPLPQHFSGKNFFDLRQTDPEQYRYMWGEEFESLPLNNDLTASQLSASRNFVIKDTQHLLPQASPCFYALQSLAQGGLGGAWGLGCASFDAREATKVGLDHSLLHKHYQKVADRIGITSGYDDIYERAAKDIHGLLPAVSLDKKYSLLLSKYNKQKKYFNERGFFLGRSSLALATKNLGEREAFCYDDLEFYSDFGWSAYRPWMTISQLKKKASFCYKPSVLVLSFHEFADGIEVYGLNLLTQTQSKWRCRRLILSAGAVGTARIVLRSFSLYEKKVPILCNPVFYLPFLHLAFAGKALEERKTGLAQLFLYYQKASEETIACSLYSYRSLPLTKLIKDSPLPVREGRIIQQFLQSALSIALVQFSDFSTQEKNLLLRKDETQVTKDIAIFEYKLTEIQEKNNHNDAKKIKRYLQKLGVLPLFCVNTNPGASVHYAGTLPYGNKSFLNLNPHGRLQGTNNIYVADGSGFQYLPAKNLTWTLMAIGSMVGEKIAAE